jgi:colanic acid/amylovoran biosynthesis protein
MGGVNDLFDNGLAIVRLLRLAQSEQKPTFLLGQGLGPIENPLLREEASNVFARTELIGVRESAYSPQLAISLGAAPDKVHVTGDDALDLAHQYTPDCLGDALGVNLRLASYSDVGVEFVAKVRKVLDEVKCRLQAHMLPVPISFRPTESDLDTCEALGVTRPESVSCIPSDVIRLAGRCRVVVTGAYHAGVFSLAQGVPVVGISNSQYYDYKLLGLASMFPGACDVISLADPEFEDRLLMSICAKWESAPRIRQEILRRTQSQIRESRLLYQKMLDSLENRSVAGSAESPVRNPEPPQ